MAKHTAPRLRKPPKKLTDRARCFAHEYPIDLNATKAAKRAGYSKRTATAAASRLLRNVNGATCKTPVRQWNKPSVFGCCESLKHRASIEAPMHEET